MTTEEQCRLAKSLAARFHSWFFDIEDKVDYLIGHQESDAAAHDLSLLARIETLLQADDARNKP